ncbi:hypothetical protein [Alkalilimnicola ehrlichii]|uniref:hypothetical protein n=1 Tax=Alkalilimnicola ehrlichii TaxID=351052 RepID=UPI003B9DF30E
MTTARPAARALLPTLLAFAMLCAGPVALGATLETRVIQLQHQPAEALIPLLEPQLDQTRLSGRHFQLLLRGPGAELDAAEQMLRQLDQPTRAVTLTLRFEEGPVRREEREGTVIHRHATGRVSREQRVLAQEGREVVLRLEQALPREQRRIYLSPHALLLDEQPYYLTVEQTLVARPLLHGDDRVTVALSALSQRLDPQDPESVLSREWTGRLTGRVGEWILLGETRVDRDPPPEAAPGTRILRTRPADAQELRIWLRVDPAP